MARPSLRDNWKFKRLVHQLGIPVPHVIGHLECLWQVGYSCGNPFLGDKLSVEAAAEWVGEPERLFNALLECGFIETTEYDDDLFQIHDLIDHAPDYVKKRAEREEEKRRTTADNGGQRRRKCKNVCPPTPAPTPVELLRLPSEDSKEENPPLSPRPKSQMPSEQIPPTLDTPAFREAWCEWHDHRREKGKPVKPTGAKQQLTKCESLGEREAIVAIRHSINGNWEGIFHPNERQSRGHPSQGVRREGVVYDPNAKDNGNGF